jgi:hypothetical protein
MRKGYRTIDDAIVTAQKGKNRHCIGFCAIPGFHQKGIGFQDLIQIQNIIEIICPKLLGFEGKNGLWKKNHENVLGNGKELLEKSILISIHFGKNETCHACALILPTGMIR